MGSDQRPDGDPTPEGLDFEYHEDQLRPGMYPGYDHVMHGPKGRTDVGSIWTNIAPDGKGFMVTSIPFDLTDRQKAMIEAGGHIQINMWQVPMPPINCCVEGPYCECHGTEMTFDEEDGGFRCTHVRRVGDDASPLEAAHQEFKPVGDDGASGTGPDNAGDGPASPGDPEPA